MTEEEKDALRRMVRSEATAIARAIKAEGQLEDAHARADKADAKRQRARQHCIQVISQCLGGGNAQLAADALFNMLGLLYDEADDKQLYPPVQADVATPPDAL